MRRGRWLLPFWALMAVAGVCAAADRQVVDAVDLYGERADYRVVRGDQPAGRHHLTFSGDGRRLTVVAQTRATLKILGVFDAPFIYDSRAVWSDGVLLTISSAYGKGEDSEHYSAGRVAEAYRVNDRLVSLAALFPTNHWNPAVLGEERLFNTLTGKLNTVSIDAAGREMIEIDGRRVEANRYEVRGDLQISLWYDDDGKWLQLRFGVLGTSYHFVYSGEDG